MWVTWKQVPGSRKIFFSTAGDIRALDKMMVIGTVDMAVKMELIQC